MTQETTEQEDGGGFPGIGDLLFDDIEARMAEIEAEAERVRDWHRGFVGVDDLAGRTACDEPALFNLLSTPVWLELARLAGVPHIPMQFVAALDADHLDGIFAADEVAQAAGEEFDRTIRAALDEGWTLRFEHVAPSEVKARLSDGEDGVVDGVVRVRDHSHVADNDFVDLGDPRLIETFHDFGVDELKAYVRPWIAPLRVAADGTVSPDTGPSWPVEFRVFVQNGEVSGVANYYVQSRLELDRFAATAGEAVRSARRVLAELETRAVRPANGRLLGADAPMDITLDFALGADGVLRLVDSGPAGGVRAHPCAFGGFDGLAGLEGFTPDGEVIVALEDIAPDALEDL